MSSSLAFSPIWGRCIKFSFSLFSGLVLLSVPGFSRVPSLQPSLTASLPPALPPPFAALHLSVKCSWITSASRPPTLCNITSSVTSSNVEHVRHLKTTANVTSYHIIPPPGVGVGQFFLGESQSRIYLSMCAKFGCGPTVVSKKRGGYRQTDKGTLQLYTVDCFYSIL